MSGEFEAKEVRQRASKLPTDLPDPAAMEREGRADGQIYRLTSGPNAGQRFRLRHSRTVAAKWVPVVKRQPKGTKKAK